MSALKEPRRVSPPELVAAAKAQPLQGEAWEKYRMTLPSREEHLRPWKYEGKMTLAYLKEPRTNHAPRDWRYAGIEQSGNTFAVVWMGSRITFSATDLRHGSIDPLTKVLGLTLAQALKTGAAVDAAMAELLKEPEKPKKTPRK